jgi:hypothetical protein
MIVKLNKHNPLESVHILFFLFFVEKNIMRIRLYDGDNDYDDDH